MDSFGQKQVEALATLAATAAERKDGDAPYGGELSATEVWNYITDYSGDVIDVRTEPEWRYVGTPALDSSKAKLSCLSWMEYPDYNRNPNFIAELKARVADMAAPLFFLCKVGGRSFQAANEAAQHGYTHAFNITYGFEGAPNDNGQRGCVNGWKAEGLPWAQA